MSVGLDQVDCYVVLSWLRRERLLTTAEVAQLAGCGPALAKSYMQVLERKGKARRIRDGKKNLTAIWEAITETSETNYANDY